MNGDRKKSLRLAFTGDLALAGEFVRKARPAGKPLTFPFEQITGSLVEAEVVVVNLEGPIGTEGTPRPGKSVLIHNDSEVLDWLARLPNCVCCLANNHIMDYGAEALERTKRLLAERGIHSIGAGATDSEASQELSLTINGFTLAILAFTTSEAHVGSVLAGSASPGASGLPDESTLCSRVSDLAKEVDAVVVLLHWGYEYFHYPTPEQVALCRKLASAGATCVVGHHPHVQQGLERAADSLICYSLGNLLLPEMRTTNGRLQYRKPATKQFALLKVEVEKQTICGWKMEGGRCDKHYNLVPYSGHGATIFDSRIQELSCPLAVEKYAEFYASYALTRRRELKRQEIFDSAVKLLRTDLTTLRKTFSIADLNRNVRRLFAVASQARKQA